MFVATMESESMSWVSLGSTKEEALEAIRKKWNTRQRVLKKSGRIYGTMIFKNTEDIDNYYGISVYELNCGECEAH